MASPDLAAYFGLQFYDIDPQSVYELGAATLAREIPELDLREGQIETLLLESVAEEVAESVFAINRVPDQIFEALLKMLGINRDIGTQPIVNLRFEVNRSDGCTIPGGTNVAITIPNDLGKAVFTTVEDLFILPDETSGVVQALGLQYTDLANGIPANTNCELLDSIAFVDFVKTDSEIAGGRNPESEEEHFARGVQRLSRLSSTLVLPAHFSAAALEISYITRALALDNYNASADADLNGPVGADPGYVTVAVYGENDFVSSDNKTALLADLRKNALAILNIQVIDAIIQKFDISTQIHILPDFDPSAVVTNITDALKERFSVEVSPWNTPVRRNDIVSIISRTDGVAFVDSVTTPAIDVQPSKIATIMVADNISVSVVN